MFAGHAHNVFDKMKKSEILILCTEKKSNIFEHVQKIESRRSLLLYSAFYDLRCSKVLNNAIK